jgi:hypothetical protein
VQQGLRRGHEAVSSTRATFIGDHQILASTGVSYVTLSVISPTRSGARVSELAARYRLPAMYSYTIQVADVGGWFDGL